MTTIKLKNGSGAPTAGDLVQGEPALDLTNKRLYTEDSGGTVIEVGTNPTSITTGDITATGTATFAGLGTTGDVTFGDNDKAIFGAGSDLQIYHNGSNSFIQDVGTGNLYITTNGSEIRLAPYGANENGIRVLQDGAVFAYYDNSAKLATTSTGIDVTGTVVSDGLTVDSGATDEVARFEGTGSPYISWYDTGVRQGYIGSFGSTFSIVGDTPDTTVAIATGGATRVNVNSSGIDVTGTVTADDLTAQSNTPTVNLVSPNGSNGYRFFSNVSDTVDGGIFLQDVSASNANRLLVSQLGDISFYNSAGTSQDLYWDASTSRLGLGTTSPQKPLVISNAGANGIEIEPDSASGNRIFSFNRSTSAYTPLLLDGDSLRFRTGSTATERMRIDSSGHAIIPAGVTLGTSVGAYVAANTLDDYEEGTFTPTLTFGGADTGNVYASQSGRYTKVGNVVHVFVYVRLTTLGTATGNAEISGLPFTANATAEQGGSVGYFVDLTGLTSTPIARASGTVIEIRDTTSADALRMTHGNFTNTSDLRLQITYEV